MVSNLILLFTKGGWSAQPYSFIFGPKSEKYYQALESFRTAFKNLEKVSVRWKLKRPVFFHRQRLLVTDKLPVAST